eukprot:96388-Hanusia_phi.AAC.5
MCLSDPRGCDTGPGPGRRAARRRRCPGRDSPSAEPLPSGPRPGLPPLRKQRSRMARRALGGGRSA